MQTRWTWALGVMAGLAMGSRTAEAQFLERRVGVRATAEVGFVGAAAHFITLGLNGSRVDYVEDGDQNTLFPFARLSAEVDIDQRHLITLLYQPLQLDTTATLSRDLTIDDERFAAGTPVRFRYGFPFWRVGWAYDVLPSPTQELAFGVGLQIRNATIDFESLDGRQYRRRSDVGPVPLLRARGRFPFAGRGFFAFEVDGFYAPISVLNGSDNEVTGAILDASVRVGARVMPHVDVFVNLRYLGGGATGQGSATPTSDGYQSNWLNFISASLGATIDSRP